MTLSRQLEAGIRFLLRNQDLDGAWRDFQLRPGRSDAWTTAFVAMRLLACAHGRLRQPVQKALLMAAQFLENTREPHGGWAYNRRCPADADSTACAILFLHAFSATVQARDYAALARFQLQGGGFATYRFASSQHPWCVVHPEVTVTSLRALAHFLPPDHFRIRNGLGWLSHHIVQNGARSSYWWLSPHYLAIEVERLRRVFPALPFCEEPNSGQFHGCFDLALRLEEFMFRRADGSIREIRSELVKLQHEDGGWPPSAILRIPDPRKSTGDAVIAMDDCRLLTTAATVSALRTAQIRVPTTRRESRPDAVLSPPA